MSYKLPPLPDGTVVFFHVRSQESRILHRNAPNGVIAVDAFDGLNKTMDNMMSSREWNNSYNLHTTLPCHEPTIAVKYEGDFYILLYEIDWNNWDEAKSIIKKKYNISLG